MPRVKWPAGVRERRRLAKAETLMLVATTVQRWANDLRGIGVRPVAEWIDGDPLGRLCATYGLTPEELAVVLDGIAEQTEQRALRIGYEEAWA